MKDLPFGRFFYDAFPGFPFIPAGFHLRTYEFHPVDLRVSPSVFPTAIFLIYCCYRKMWPNRCESYVEAGGKTMTRYKKGFIIFIVLGFVVVTAWYVFVMTGTAKVSGTISVGSSIVPQEINGDGQKDSDMVAVNGYVIKGPNSENRELLSTKNKFRSGKLEYSFTAKEGMRYFIVAYLQLDHLTGEIGQTLELRFMTAIIKKGDMKRDFIITFQELNGINTIRITAAESSDITPKVFEYHMNEIPDIIKL